VLAAEVNLLIKQFVWDLDTKAFYNTERKSKDTIYGVRISPRQKQTGACQGGGPTQVVQNIGGGRWGGIADPLSGRWSWKNH